MRDNGFAVRMNRGGELIQDKLGEINSYKYKPDTPFMGGPVPFILMAACILIDVSFFRSLFVRISYDDPMMIILEVAGLAFAADVVASYAGIVGKRIQQGISRDKLTLYMLLSVPILALVVNGALRVATMPLMSVDGTVDAAAIALTIIAIVVPVFTSVGNFAISFQTYDPLATRMWREEVALDEVRDYCRRLVAIREEVESFSEESMKAMDRQRLANAKKELINDALMRFANVRVKLMEELGDPTSTNVLSKSRCDEIFERINGELKSLEITCDEKVQAEIIEKKRAVSLSEAA